MLQGAHNLEQPSGGYSNGVRYSGVEGRTENDRADIRITVCVLDCRCDRPRKSIGYSAASDVVANAAARARAQGGTHPHLRKWNERFPQMAKPKMKNDAAGDAGWRLRDRPSGKHMSANEWVP
jgi:hypothetical protein